MKIKLMGGFDAVNEKYLCKKEQKIKKLVKKIHFSMCVGIFRAINRSPSVFFL